MKKDLRAFFAVAVFVISFFIFNLLEFQPLNSVMNIYFQSIVFSTTLSISIFIPSFRKKLFSLAFLLLLGMLGFYLMQQLLWANALSSLGIGMLAIISLTYLPELFKEGFIEKI